MHTRIESIALDDDTLEQVDGAWIGPALRGVKLAFDTVKTVAKSPYARGLMTGWSLNDLLSGSSPEKDNTPKVLRA